MDYAKVPMRFRPVVIYWIDAHADATSWTSVSDIDEDPYLVQTVGFELEKLKPGHVSVAQSSGDDDGVVDHVLHIPAQMIKSMRYLVVDTDEA
jgi:hypothetical protein